MPSRIEMRVTSSQIIIDDPLIVELYQKKQSPKFLRTCEEVLILLGQVPETVDSCPEDRIMSKLNQLTGDIISAMPQARLNLSEIVSEVKSATENLSVSVKDSTRDIASKVDSFSHKRKTNTFKGKEGEKILSDIIQQNFNPHDGYTLTNVSGNSRSCDLVLKRPTFTDIRIESKAYGADSEKVVEVNETEVKKFISDLIQLNQHGILVSLYGGVTHRNPIDMEFVPTTKKFAFYVSGTEHIPDIIRIIYRLDYAVQSDEDNDDGSKIITPDNIAKIRDCIKDFANKIVSVSTHLNHSLEILKTMTYSVIEKIIFMEPPDETLQCQRCLQIFKSKKRHENHVNANTCKKKNSVSIDGI